MKRILMIIGIILVAGCSKNANNLIVGTWAMVDFSVTNLRTGEKVNGKTDIKMWTFNENGYAFKNGSTPLTYVLNGGHLTFTYLNSGNKQSFDVLKLNDKNLEVTWTSTPGAYQDASEWWYCFAKME